MYLTGARIAPLCKKKLFTEKKSLFTAAQFCSRSFFLHIYAQCFMHNASHMDWDFFYRRGWGGVPYQGVELRQHLLFRALGAGCRQLFQPGSTWAGQEKKSSNIKTVHGKAQFLLHVGFGRTTRSWAAHTRLFRLINKQNGALRAPTSVHHRKL
jgi:hypothetical protein